MEKKKKKQKQEIGEKMRKSTKRCQISLFALAWDGNFSIPPRQQHKGHEYRREPGTANDTDVHLPKEGSRDKAAKNAIPT